MRNGLLEQLAGYLEVPHPVRGLWWSTPYRRCLHRRRSAYSADYKEVGALEAFGQA